MWISILIVSLSVPMSFPAYLGMDYKNHSGKDESGKDFTGASLANADFSDAICVGTRFDRANLKKANFKGANLKAASFYEADLTEADLTGATGAFIFSYTTLNKANLEGMKELDIRGNCKLRNANLRKTKITSWFSECDLSEADLRGANLRGCLMKPNVTGRFKGAKYDDDTAFPDGVDPKDFAMKYEPLKEEKKDKDTPVKK